jgi:DNA-binding NarL/FixJ family response regulator
VKRVLICASSSLVVAGLRSVIQGISTCEVADSVVGLEHLHQMIQETQPGIVLLEVSAERQEVADEILAHAGIDFLLFIDFMANASRFLRAGARAILSRQASEEEIIAAVKAVEAGLVVVQREQTELLFAMPRSVSADADISAALTLREREVLNAIAAGASNKIIAIDLKISEHTVKFHINSIFGKLGVSSRTEAVAAGIRLGLVVI